MSAQVKPMLSSTIVRLPRDSNLESEQQHLLETGGHDGDHLDSERRMPARLGQISSHERGQQLSCRRQE